jgi:hypothetical protein
MNVVEMKPATSGKASAKPVNDAAGHALGKVLIKEAKATAEADKKAREKRKDTLKRIEGFTRENHLSFRAELEAERSIMALTAETEGMNVTEFRKHDSVFDAVYVTVSLWLKLSRAVEKGYKPDYAESWQYIDAKATETLHATATDDGTPLTNAAPTIRKGRPKADVVEKACKYLDNLNLNAAQTAAIIAHLSKK